MPDEIKKIIFDMKSKAEELKEGFFDKVNNREMSIAQTNFEQAMMWATKAWVNEVGWRSLQISCVHPVRVVVLEHQASVSLQKELRVHLLEL